MSDSENGKPEDGTLEPAEPQIEAKAAADETKAQAAADAKAKAAAAAKAKADEADAEKEPWEKDPVVPELAEADGDPLVEELVSEFGESIQSAQSFAGDLVLEVGLSDIRDVCRSLKERHGYTLLVDICGAHFPQRESEQLEVIYIFYSLEQNRRVRLKVGVAVGVEVPSLTPVYAGANWPEREIYDMFGIRFSQHPDMTRILLWEGFNGHPLLKEFPLEGIDTGAAIYPEYYEESAGPIAGTGTGWQPPAPPAEPDGGDADESETP
jgi:NADH-quinone oxidoreductase subunit C